MDNVVTTGVVEWWSDDGEKLMTVRKWWWKSGMMRLWWEGVSCPAKWWCYMRPVSHQHHFFIILLNILPPFHHAIWFSSCSIESSYGGGGGGGSVEHKTNFLIQVLKNFIQPFLSLRHNAGFLASYRSIADFSYDYISLHRSHVTYVCPSSGVNSWRHRWHLGTVA